MNPAWRHALVALTAIAVAAVWPLTPALPPGDVLQARLGAAVVAAIAVALLALRGGRPGLWIAVSIGSAAAGVLLLFAHFNALAGCVADYDGQPAIIGREYTPDAAPYISATPGLAPSDRLLDAGGVPERIWSAASIRSCRLWASWGATATIPLFAVSVGALMTRGRHRFVSGRRNMPPVVAGTPAGAAAYDAFISYRHTEPDKTYAIEVLESLERRGLRVAIDFRDFAPNEHFLPEMERCIKGSRYVLCVITARYLASDHTSEEAIISKTLDMAERRKRLVPLVFERVELPVWLHGLVGIDFTELAAVEPTERLLGLLAAPPVQR